MPKVLIADNIDDICDKLLQEAGIKVDRKIGLPIEELTKIIPSYNGIVVRSSLKLKGEGSKYEEFFEAFGSKVPDKELKIIGRAGAGVDTIDMDLVNKYGMTVVNTPTSNSVSVAELAFTHILALSKKLIYADTTTKQGKFEKKILGKTGMELYEKTIGIIGLGNIGKRVANRAESFKMNVIYCDPYVTSKKYNSVSLEELFRQSDVVTVHVPNIPETKGMITKELLSLLKENAIFVNTARVNIIKGDALYEVLKERKNIWAGIDVYDKDEAKTQPLAQFRDRVILTPHIGGSTPEAQIRGAEGIAKQFIEFFKEGRAEHMVNFAAIPEELYPFLDLTEKLALMSSYLIESQPNTIEISCYGKLNEHSKLLSRAAIKGVLQFNTDMFVNYINAPYIAQEKEIKTNIRTPDEAKGYGDAVTVDLVVDGKRTSIRGNLNYDKQPIISRVDNFLIDFIPRDSSVFIYKDSLGVLGTIGTVCGNEGVSMEDITTRKYRVLTQKTETGRYKEETAAITIVNPALDDMIMDKILRHLRTEVYIAKNVKF